MFFAEFVLDAEQLALRLVEGHEARRIVPRQLAAELRPDGARGAGDQDGSSVNAGAHRRFVQFDRLTAQ